ncbi:MAG: hypothetical protein M3019_09140 [Candidatus Dormibacteraeota bacterium]|nr:hypothetical protein [Candidatus Dormibacteraeota bacterium]
MRRPRPHRLTGSVRRLLAAGVLGGLAAALAGTAASEPASAGGLTLNLNLGSVNLSGLPALATPSWLPALPTLPGLPTATPPPPSTSPGLPKGGSVPPLCPPATCPSTSSNGTSGTTPSTSTTPTNTGSASRSAPTSRSSFGAAPGVGVGAGESSSAGSTLGSPQSAGLSMTAPPPVAQLTPLAGISFGRAPYLWPLFLLLDLIAAAAVVVLVRRTWSPTFGAD